MIYIAGTIIGLGDGAVHDRQLGPGHRPGPTAEAGRYLGVSNLAGAGAGIVGAGIGGLVADF